MRSNDISSLDLWYQKNQDALNTLNTLLRSKFRLLFEKNLRNRPFNVTSGVDEMEKEKCYAVFIVMDTQLQSKCSC